MVGLLDPDDDRQAELVAGGPAAAVRNIFFQQREERLHGGVIGADADPATDPCGWAWPSIRTLAWERNRLPRSDWTMALAGPRSATALRSALTADSSPTLPPWPPSEPCHPDRLE